MISESDFVNVLQLAIPRFSTHTLNSEQTNCILHDPNHPLMIVAGPGTGKTTVLVLRALRLVFVEEILPEEIFITTFTKKAASELRSRLVEWGSLLRTYIRNNPPPSANQAFPTFLNSVDVNRFITGTLDSLCEDIIGMYRDPTDPSPILIENFIGDSILTQQAILPTGANNSTSLKNYLANFNWGNQPKNLGQLLYLTRSILDRFVHDQIDLDAFEQGVPETRARERLVEIYQRYRQSIKMSHRIDFAALEELFLERIQQRHLVRFTNGLKAILIDEYQDTNPLQESIYFELLRQTNASLTVVGDDDQSLYRFRGATVEVFCDFQNRLQTFMGLGIPLPRVMYLFKNYRSTPEITSFFNTFIQSDPDFFPARVQPPKPLIQPQLPSSNIPILGMFRDSVEDLARDLSNILHKIFRDGGFTHTDSISGQTVQLTPTTSDGDFGDAVLLSHTVNELGARWGKNPPRERLPLLMRRELDNQFQIGVFNPRGRALRDIPEVKQLLGLMLECIDPSTNARSLDGRLQSTLKLTSEATVYMQDWRQVARNYIATNPNPNNPHSLSDFVMAWQQRQPQNAQTWPEEWPLLELCFKLISWLPFLRHDPEGQVYLEAIARCISQSAAVSSLRSMIIRHSPEESIDDSSIVQIIRNIFEPLASNAIEVDEDIMPHVPRDRLQFMTIHQAKGLEFPLVITDISSDYPTNHPKTRFRRFPDNPSGVQLLEDDLAPYSQIGALRLARSALDRTFDDLLRTYYVAYSRAQSALILVGLRQSLRYKSTIKHVGLGWRRAETWSWRSAVSGKPPGLVNNLPFFLI